MKRRGEKGRRSETNYLCHRGLLMLLLLDFGVDVLLCCSESVGVLEDWFSSEESALSALGSGSFVSFFFNSVVIC